MTTTLDVQGSVVQNSLENEENSERSAALKRKLSSENNGGRCKVSKRKDYISWDEYFMAVAFLSAQRSKDPSSQVGACIVNGDKKIVGIGYNGMPNGCSDDILPWDREADNELDTKYPYGKNAPFNVIIRPRGGSWGQGGTLTGSEFLESNMPSNMPHPGKKFEIKF